jgi:hypothetical protein
VPCLLFTLYLSGSKERPFLNFKLKAFFSQKSAYSTLKSAGTRSFLIFISLRAAATTPIRPEGVTASLLDNPLRIQKERVLYPLGLRPCTIQLQIACNHNLPVTMLDIDKRIRRHETGGIIHIGILFAVCNDQYCFVITHDADSIKIVLNVNELP